MLHDRGVLGDVRWMDGRVEKTENGDASGVEERKTKQVGHSFL